MHSDVDRGGAVSGGPGGMGSGDLSVRERNASGGLSSKRGGADRANRSTRARRLDGLAGTVIGRIGTFEDRQDPLGAVGGEENGLTLGQRPNLQPHLGVKQRARRCR